MQMRKGMYRGNRRKYRSYAHTWLLDRLPAIYSGHPSNLDVAVMGLKAAYDLHAPIEHDGDVFCAYCSEESTLGMKHPCKTVRDMDSAIDQMLEKRAVNLELDSSAYRQAPYTYVGRSPQ